ncbi:unnamed protein product [Didymodactylos carnosus]|uniref:F-box domain-containing protein n=1 Tax=Didymodactylos carnosus TaxID=1234261 RepID=A0A815IDQ1_9BILA|nr:unnamed protein product [Didymodactylos carnosus]CAF4242016.1 unnamed protein product [Didymodactylos carnosus]
MLKLEDLSAEILLIIINHLKSDELTELTQLNSKLTSVISSVPVYVNFENISKEEYENYEKIILRFQEEEIPIRSLKLSNKNNIRLINEFLNRFDSLSQSPSFANLQSITLIDMREKECSTILLKLVKLKQLKRFSLLNSFTEDEGGIVHNGSEVRQYETYNKPLWAFKTVEVVQVPSVRLVFREEEDKPLASTRGKSEIITGLYDRGYMQTREIPEQILTTDYGQITAYYKPLAEASRFKRVNDIAPKSTTAVFS